MNWSKRWPEHHPDLKSLAILPASQWPIQAPRQQLGQFVLRRISQKVQFQKRDIHLHQIPADMEVSDNKEANVAAKKVAGWRKGTQGP